MNFTGINTKFMHKYIYVTKGKRNICAAVRLYRMPIANYILNSLTYSNDDNIFLVLQDETNLTIKTTQNKITKNSRIYIS